MTARDIIEECVNRADLELRAMFHKHSHFILFQSGRSTTIENTVTLMQRNGAEVFPLVAMFCEGVKETRTRYTLDVTIPKIAVIVKTAGTSEEGRIEKVFRPILHPIADAIERQFKAVHRGYSLEVTRYDLPCYSGKTGTAGLNSICDAVIFQNLKLRYEEPVRCGVKA